MLRVFVICFFISFSFLLDAQERTGLSYGNYNGINATHLNPAFSTKSANRWDLQIVGAHAFFKTDYLAISNAGLIKLARESGDVIVPEFTDEPTSSPEGMTIIFDDNGKTNSVAKAEVLGPGFLLTVHNFKFGIQAKARAMVSAKRIPGFFNPYNVENTSEGESYAFDKFNLAGAAWSEYVLHFGHELNDQVSYGINAKLLNGKVGGFVSNDEAVVVDKISVDQVNLSQGGQFSFGFTQNPAFNNSNYGFATDLGVLFQDVFKENSSLGVSLIDLGFIKIKDNQYTGLITNQTELFSEDYEEIEQADRLLDQLETDGVITETKAGFAVYMPTALSIQYSLPITNHLSAEGNIVQSVKFSKKQIARSNNLNVTMMYQRKYFAAFLPITLEEYKDPQIGLAFRVAYLTLGSDDLIGFFNQTNFDSADFYVNLNFFPFDRNKKGRGKSKKNGRGGIKCPDFKSMY